MVSPWCARVGPRAAGGAGRRAFVPRPLGAARAGRAGDVMQAGIAASHATCRRALLGLSCRPA